MASVLQMENKAACLLVCLLLVISHQLDPTNAQRRPLRQQGEEKPTEPIPVTSFSCQGRVPGYYADPESGCQLYHMCQAGGGRQFTYRCPEHTLFQQRMMVCDHWFMVDCQSSPTHYAANLLIGDKNKLFITAGETIRREFVHDPGSSQRKFTPTPSPSNINRSNNSSSNSPSITLTTPLFDQFSFPSTIINSITTPKPSTPATFPKTTIKFQPSKLSTVKITTNIPKPTQASPIKNTQVPIIGRNSRIPVKSNNNPTGTIIPNKNNQQFFNPTNVPIQNNQERNFNTQNQNSQFRNTQQPIGTLNRNTQKQFNPTGFIIPLKSTQNNANQNTPKTNNQQQNNPIGFTTPNRNTQNPINIPNKQNNPIGFTPPARNTQNTNNQNIPNRNNQQQNNPIGFTVPIRNTQEPIFNPTTQKPINKPIGLTASTLSLIKNTFNLSEVTRPIFQTTTYRPITTSHDNNDVIYPATINSLMLNNDNVPVLLKFIPDTRRMFYIPNSYEDIPSDFQQQNLEFESLRNSKAMRFINDFNNDDSTLINGCNSKCFPAFFKPGTCEPCVILR